MSVKLKPVGKVFIIGAVVAAGSVVTRNVGDYEIVAGVPARLIKKRTQKKDRSDSYQDPQPRIKKKELSK